MQDDNISSDPQIAIQQSLAALVAATQTHKELILEALSQGQPSGRAALEQRYAAIFAQRLQEHFDKIEAFDPALAARIDYRRTLPPR